MIGGLAENLRHLLATRGPLTISLLVTLLALVVYYTTFIGARPTPMFEFISRLELASLDLRFQLRERVTPDPRIVIVDVDQHAQELLGRWPFPRIHFARMLDELRKDGARVVVFDITFSQPDQSLKPIHLLRSRLEQGNGGLSRDTRLKHELDRVEKEFSHDARFAEAIERFGSVVLGNFFLYTEADLRGLTPEALDRFASLAAYHPFPQVRAARSAQGLESLANVLRILGDREFVPKGAEANLEALTSALPAETSAAGFFNVFTDPDGVVRHAQLALPYGRSEDLSEWDFYPSIDVQAVRFLLNLPNEQVVLNYGAAGIESLEFGPLTVKPDDLGRVLINYRGPTRTYPYYSLGDVLTGKFAPGTFRDKLVLVGASATGIGDLRVTPYATPDFPGVEIHANIVDNILHEDFIQRRWPQVLVDLLLILLFGVPLGLALGLIPPRWMALALLLLVPFGAAVSWAFTQGWWLNAITPSLLTLIPNPGLIGLHRVLIEERERRKTRNAFQQYISPEVIRRLLKNPELVRPRKIDVTIMFTDVRGFTTISEELDAQEVALLLNRYLSEMTRTVFQNQGTLDKYMGDGLMAFWGAPFEDTQHSAKACRAALGMLEKLTELQEAWRAEGKPLLDVGIGINTGVASVGNMGSELRYGYTVVGDSVNLASRLEGLNKLYGTRILVSEGTRGAADASELVFRELDWIRVAGKRQPVTIYELVAFRDRCGDWPQRIELFEAGLKHYRLRDWGQAHACFAQVLDCWPEDGPAQLFFQRCEKYLLENPPPSWDGVYVAQYKL